MRALARVQTTAKKPYFSLIFIRTDSVALQLTMQRRMSESTSSEFGCYSVALLSHFSSSSFSEVFVRMTRARRK